MKYYLTKIIKDISFEKAEEAVREKLKEQGFGVITEIDVKATLKEKIDKDFRPYKILGACNPHFAFKALLEEDKMGVMLPCNVCIQQKNKSEIEVFTINPLEAMKGIGSADLDIMASEVYQKMNTIIKSL
ncbi:MAG: DUF302 domain-containing protein [Prolixibacteraceae bacterium]|nr:DUF302 domain-containing protein [Prolixibacteraceae bacterium]